MTAQCHLKWHLVLLSLVSFPAVQTFLLILLPQEHIPAEQYSAIHSTNTCSSKWVKSGNCKDRWPLNPAQMRGWDHMAKTEAKEVEVLAATIRWSHLFYVICTPRDYQSKSQVLAIMNTLKGVALFCCLWSRRLLFYRLWWSLLFSSIMKGIIRKNMNMNSNSWCNTGRGCVPWQI